MLAEANSGPKNAATSGLWKWKEWTMKKLGPFRKAPRPRNPVARALRGRGCFGRHVAANGKRYRRRAKHPERVREAERHTW